MLSAAVTVLCVATSIDITDITITPSSRAELEKPQTKTPSNPNHHPKPQMQTSEPKPPKA